MRLGELLWGAKSPGSNGATPPHMMDTPLCLLYSRGGAVPNLTRDIEEAALTHTTAGASVEGAIMLTMPTMYLKWVWLVGVVKVN